MNVEDNASLELTRREALWLLRKLREVREVTHHDLRAIGERIRMDIGAKGSHVDYFDKFQELNCLDRIIAKLWIVAT